MLISTGIYIRVSTEDQAKDGFSINAQKEKLIKYSEVNDWKIHDFYMDDGISGKNLVDRPEIVRMLEDIKNNKINNVLIYKLDRLTRSMKDLIYLIEFFEKNNCTFNSQTEKIDTSNAVGRMFIKIIGIFAEFERENLAERVSFGYEQKTREGNYTNCNGVYGYDYIVKQNKLIINEKEAEKVKEIFKLYIDGMSYYKISKMFNEEKISTKRGGKWASSTIKSIINNPLYIGKIRYGLKKKNQNRSFIVKGKNINPILTEDVWKEANRTVVTRKKYAIRRYSSDNSYYYHFLQCGQCGGKILARQQKQNGKLYITYTCSSHINGICSAEGFSHKKMEKSFLNYLESINYIRITEEIMNYKYLINDFEESKSKIYLKIKSIKYEREKIKQKFVNDLLSLKEYQLLIKKINKQENYYKKELKTMSETKKETKYDNIEDILKNIKLNWIYLSNSEKKNFLEKFVSKINVKKENNEVMISSVEFVEY